MMLEEFISICRIWVYLFIKDYNTSVMFKYIIY